MCTPLDKAIVVVIKMGTYVQKANFVVWFNKRI
jgi:hypothetical protein